MRPPAAPAAETALLSAVEIKIDCDVFWEPAEESVVETADESTVA